MEETTPYIENILKYLHVHLKVTFSEFVADFIKDESGIWWMVNVKAFRLHEYPEEILVKVICNPAELEFEELETLQKDNAKGDAYAHQKQKICKYCEEIYQETELNHKMTLKMIIQTDRHLMHRNKELKWLSRNNLQTVDSSLLYQEHKVCKTW